ncbi:Eco57I restriction-modification methylase domain-containing protein [Algoriphagus yeomjeoni]|nr:N-6 DNA methylase [Algoriphagus yeomjeoni]
MTYISSIHSQLTSHTTVDNPKDLVLNFAKHLGWNPSYFIEPSANEKSNGYLVIEHGLENSAIISFLTKRNEELTSREEENLLAISYNNLVGWHITIDDRYINYYFILNKQNRQVESKKIEIGNEEEALKVSTFYEVIKRKPNSNIRALDDVLIENISNWKRIISAELNNSIDLVTLSYLFNGTIFLRSIEDSKKRANEIDSHTNILLDILSLNKDINISNIFEIAQEKLSIKIPEHIVPKDKVKLFNRLDNSILKRYFYSFYENEYNRFRYDFSIMTKQALSRIYQKYVSILSVVQSNNQGNLFTPIPIEKINKDNGAYYTPEYIARFFSKYICKRFTDGEFDNLKILEPSVGSGIFLRTLLETEIEERISKKSNFNIDKLFNNVTGIDLDPNACLATNLSLTLLHYIFNKTFAQPDIITGDSLTILQEKIKKKENFDIVISNPPYINQDNKSEEETNKNKIILEGLNNGKIDTYQAFIKLSVDILNPNGLGLFVLPHNFLTAKSSKKLRNYLLDHCYIELVADLSTINVFDKVGTYTMLLIFRKKDHLKSLNTYTWLLKCRTSVGEALNQLLIENETNQRQYQIYKAENYFNIDEEWYILNKPEFDLLNKLKSNKNIDTFLKVNQGIITGNDEVFIRNSNSIDNKEKDIYKTFLPDKEIERFTISKKSQKVLFYPYTNNIIITKENLQDKFPKSWEYMQTQKKKIYTESTDVKKEKRVWWSLHRPRRSEYINAPKIVCPYISISPKFALDLEGKFATSRSPYFILKEENLDPDLLFYFLGILNSVPCYWALSLQAHKQSSGYNIFHLNLLGKTPVPDPTLTENSSLVSKMILLVKKRIIEKNELKKLDLESEINLTASDLYKLNPTELELLGL